MAYAINDTKDGVSATGIVASATVGPFILLGGKYGVGVSDTGTANGSLKLQMPDGSFVALGGSTTFSAAGFVAVDLPAGTFEFVAGSGITLGAFLCQRIPYAPR